MAKINATYSSGYYLAPDTDYRKLEEQQQRERKRKRQQERSGDDDSSSGGGAIRQTFAIPFNVICLHCNHRIARGTHGYVNRRPTKDKYMGLRIWELEFRCIFCKGHIYLTTDYETAKLTGGYHCSRNCKRGEGDFYGMNQINEAMRAKQAAEEAERGTVDTLEKENETIRQIQERERLIEELVESRASAEDVDIRDELLHAIRARKKQKTTATSSSSLWSLHEERDDAGMMLPNDNDDNDIDVDEEKKEEEDAYQRFETQLRYWREEAERVLHAQSKSDAGDDREVAAVITAKYNDRGTKQKNAFMGESDSDIDAKNEKGEGNEGKATTKANGKILAVSKTTTTTTTTTTVVRGKGSALASLLDD